MSKILNQFRRLYDDKGADDHDFTDQEERLRVAHEKLTEATQHLLKSSEILNSSALSSFQTKH